jgi:hypothetical protein
MQVEIPCNNNNNNNNNNKSIVEAVGLFFLQNTHTQIMAGWQLFKRVLYVAWSTAITSVHERFPGT